LHPSHIGEGLGWGGCFFASFFAPKKVRNSARWNLAKKVLGFYPINIYPEPGIFLLKD
jgi:hypothetical protein